MTRKKEISSSVSQEDTVHIQQLLEQFHQVAQDLHSSSNQEQAEAALSEINRVPEASQLALVKALSKEDHTDAADVLIAINELSPLKSVRKEARRSLIRLEGAKIYPRWKPPLARTPAIQIPVSNPPRFWKGSVSQSREEGEVHLLLCWEEGYDYNEARTMTFILDFWEQGVKEFLLENTTRRNVDTVVQQMRAQLPDVTLADCTLAEGRRLLEEALSVNQWRGTAPHKEYRHHLPTIKQLVLEAEDAGEDRGLTFINPTLEADEVTATFITAWALGDYGLSYDLLSSNSSLRSIGSSAPLARRYQEPIGAARGEWIEQRRAWANEAHPSRFELGFIHEREAETAGLWLPSSFGGRNLGSRKEIEMGWSLELTGTQLSGTLKEMPMGTAVYKETGRHWFWTSYSLSQEEGAWRIQNMTDQGARTQALSISELQQRINEHDERINEVLREQGADTPDIQQTAEEIVWRIVQTLHYDDALIVHLPLDRKIYGDAYHRAISLGALERTIVYLERIARNFAEQRGEVLRQLGITQEALAEHYIEQGMEERAQRFSALALVSLRESLAIDNNIAGHAVLAEMIIRQGGDFDEAEAHLNQARELATGKTEEATIESDFGNMAAERSQPKEALRHYQRAAEIDPNFAGIWFKIGLMQRSLNQLEDAKASYERAIELQPGDLSPYAELTALYMKEGQLAKARELLEQGLRGNPRSAYLLTLLSSVYLESGDLRHANAVLEEAEQINPRLDIVQAMREELNRRKKIGGRVFPS